MDALYEIGDKGPKTAMKKTAATDMESGFSPGKINLAPIGRSLDPFLLQAILLKMENKGLRIQVQHRKRVELFHQILSERYAHILKAYETFVPEPQPVVVQVEESNQVDPSVFETRRIEQLAKRISHIKISDAKKNRMVAEIIDDGDFKEVEGLFEKTSMKDVVAQMLDRKPKPKKRSKLNTPEQSELACHRWQVSIGLVLGLAKIAAFSMFEENDQFKVGELLFEPSIIKETKEANTLTSECKFVLGMMPEKRSVEQIEQVIKNILLLGVKSFEEYPHSIQLKLAQIGRYEVVNQQRVIMKQGRPAEHFYFLIEGAVVAIEKEHYTEVEDTENGEVILNEDESEDLVILRKGTMFGETEMVNMLKRRVTAISKVRSELLSITRHEFLKVLVERPHLSDPPNHIIFLQQCEFVDQWPVLQLQDDLDHCWPYFFKKNSVIVEDSVKTDFLVVIRSGECRVIRKLYKRKLLTDVNPEPTEKSGSNKMRDYNDEMFRKNFRNFTSNQSSGGNLESNEGADPVDPGTTDIPPPGEIIDDHPALNQTEKPDRPTDIKRLGEKSKSRSQRLGSRTLSRHRSSKMIKSIRDIRVENDLHMENSKDDQKVAAFIQIDALGDYEVFGLETLVFDKYYDTSDNAGLCLVSGEGDAGVEVVLVSKSYFIENASEQVAWKVRRMMKSYPDTASLMDEIERQELWGASKSGLKDDVFTGRPLLLKKTPWKF